MTEQPIQLSPKISINICTHRYMNPFFVNSVLFMLDYMNKTGMRFLINSHMGVSNIVGGRQQRVNESIKDMMERGCTHTLFIDDDMVFSMDMVHKMLNEMNKLTVDGIRKLAMGVNPCRKSPVDLYYTAKPIDAKDPDEFLKSKGKSGVVEVSACGLGVFLIETALLAEIAPPHFGIEWVEEKQEHAGEDFYFIKKLRENGVRIFVDQDISQSIGHAGEFIYSYASYNTPLEVPVV